MTNKLWCLFVLTLYPSPHWVGQVNIWLWWWKSWIPALQQTHLVLDSRFSASSLGPASVWSIQSMPDCLPPQSGNRASSWLPCLLWAFNLFPVSWHSLYSRGAAPYSLWPPCSCWPGPFPLESSVKELSTSAHLSAHFPMAPFTHAKQIISQLK